MPLHPKDTAVPAEPEALYRFVRDRSQQREGKSFATERASVVRSSAVMVNQSAIHFTSLPVRSNYNRHPSYQKSCDASPTTNPPTSAKGSLQDSDGATSADDLAGEQGLIAERAGGRLLWGGRALHSADAPGFPYSAVRISSARLRHCSFSIILALYTSTVRGLIFSRAAISR